MEKILVIKRLSTYLARSTISYLKLIIYFKAKGLIKQSNKLSQTLKEIDKSKFSLKSYSDVISLSAQAEVH